MLNSMSASCVRCQKIKSANRKSDGLLFPISAPAPGHPISLDFVSKFTPAVKTKHEQCLVLVDKFLQIGDAKGLFYEGLCGRHCSNVHGTCFSVFRRAASRVV